MSRAFGSAVVGLFAVIASVAVIPRAQVQKPFIVAEHSSLDGAPKPVLGDRALGLDGVAPRSVQGDSRPANPPPDLASTGLFLPGSATDIDPRNLAYVPQYPLWSDGAQKRRWIYLPPGSSIDASDPNAWEFPAGTKLWKEFRFRRRVETRYIERRPDGTYRYATYVWNAEGTAATLAPERGLRHVVPLEHGVDHDVPGQSDCRACHEARKSPVLGFNALQLSPERDPKAAHRESMPVSAVDLKWLIERGLLRNWPDSGGKSWPRISAPDPSARAALGYLYANCATCHNSEGPLASLGLDFDQTLGDNLKRNRVNRSAVGKPSQFLLAGESASMRVSAGHPERSAVFIRMASRDPSVQMPPLGTHLVDREGVALIKRWILHNPESSISNEKE